TSVLVKLYHNEINSEKIIKQLKSVNQIYLSEIAELEFCSAIWKKFRTKEIEKDKANTVISLFFNDLTEFKWINIDSKIVNSAFNLLSDFGEIGLRTLDSIQLASALTLKENDCLFYSEDKLLRKIFEKLKLNCF
ncbi:MAG: type II toxin-antitoxin system VapC family toxin, partial [Candidatus Cloacimonetes bacterium]|nr:type II toxin-antitoxin system VapC family toxin [Candidatus Cloacimonadota bacterium]